MGASVQPVQPSSQEIARIQGNVAKMRAQGAPESDVLAYLQHEDSQATPTQDTSLSLRNLGRSAVQGATFGFGDEMHLTDRAKENAFKAEHPIADFLAKLGGGVVAPAAAVVAAPTLGTTLGGAALLSGTVGALNAAGDSEGSATDRLEAGVGGGLLGAGGGVLGYGAGKAIGTFGRKILDRLKPERAVVRAASGLLTPDVATATSNRLAQVDAIAPGGASVVTASAPADGMDVSRFLPMLRGIGSSPAAAAKAEKAITGQIAVLQTARGALGTKMDALSGTIPAPSPGVMEMIHDVLGSKAPEIPAGSTTMSVADARTALSRLRADARTAARQGTNVNGARLHDVAQAKAALQSHIYAHAPGFEALDKPYATVMDQIANADDALTAVQKSGASHAANDAYGAMSGSLGGSLPNTHGAVMALVESIMTNKAGAADAVARLITKPGGPGLLKGLVKQTPRLTGSMAGAPFAAAAQPPLRGLLFPNAQPSP